MERILAAIVTVGSELTEGLHVDTNSAEIARELGSRGVVVFEAVSVPDDLSLLASTLRRLLARYDLVITTGGLGPTHDDITREAAAQAVDATLVRDDRLVELLSPSARLHKDAEACSRTFRQAEVIPGARIIDPVTGTAPGLVIRTPRGMLALLPGPPSEMRPMLDVILTDHPRTGMDSADLGVVGLTESDAQVRVSRVLDEFGPVRFTVLARPGDVRIILSDDGVGADVFSSAVDAVVTSLGEHCYTTEGLTLAQVTVQCAIRCGLTLSCAESCTGGMIASELTSVAGASAVFLGAAVTYSNESKSLVLGVDEALISEHGAVSGPVALAMARGARERFRSDIAVATTGIAGPGGGSPDKPVGLVWLAVASATNSIVEQHQFRAGSRVAVRARATAGALDLLRRDTMRG